MYPESYARKYYNKYEDLVSTINAGAPSACNQMFQTDLDQKWIYMNNQALFVSSAISGASLGVGLAFVVLCLATQHPQVAAFATLTILSALVSVAGCMVIFGWTLGTIEAILISITAGFSVDCK